MTVLVLGILAGPLALGTSVSNTATGGHIDVQTELQGFATSDLVAGDLFGQGVAVCDDVAVILRPGYSTPASLGSAYVYISDEGTWRLVQEISAKTPLGFGFSVALSDTRIVLADAFESGSVGAAYVYRRDDRGTVHPLDDIWLEEATLTSSDVIVNFSNGGVAIDQATEETIVVSATTPGGIPAPGPLQPYGAVYVFRRDDGGTPDDEADDQWYEQAKLTPPSRSIVWFGTPIAISNDIIVTAATHIPSNERDLLIYSIYRGIHSPIDDHVVLEAVLASKHSLGGNLAFGNAALAIDDGVIVAGAPGANTAVVFERGLFGWEETTALGVLGSKSFGFSVAVEDDLIVVGSIGNQSSAGAIYAFERNYYSEWQLERVVSLPDAEPFDYFGQSVAVSQGRILAGAPGKNSYAGAAYVILPQ